MVEYENVMIDQETMVRIVNAKAIRKALSVNEFLYLFVVKTLIFGGVCGGVESI